MSPKVTAALEVAGDEMVAHGDFAANEGFGVCCVWFWFLMYTLSELNIP